MSQPSITHYFNSRKRPAVDEYKLESKQKLLKLDQQILKRSATSKNECITPPPSRDVKKRVNDLNTIKNLLHQSTKQSKLKESIDRFKKSAEQLRDVEGRIAFLSKSPNLKTFKSLEFEVTVSPQKLQSPEKLYLSPKKGVTARKNLLNVLSSTRNSTPVLYDSSLSNDDADKARVNLQLPFKYKTLMEMFRGLDTVVQLLYNRREIITFNRLKPAIEELVKRTFLLKHVAQIKSIYPNAYDYAQKKVKVYGSGQTQWELVLTPAVETEVMTTQDLLHRRRKIHQTLIDKVKEYHNEFLLSLTPPIVISKDNITHWHPEFDLEKVPEITLTALPESPAQQTHISGKAVLENAHRLFSCNKRMSQAFLGLKATSDKDLLSQQETGFKASSIIKGIPPALLEKVRQKQAAKALISMTRTADQEKEVNMFFRLPEIARLVRNLFVTEKKSVLELGIVVDKLANSYRTFLTKLEIENHLKIISSEAPEWLVFHNIRNCVYLKLAKNTDLSVVIKKLETLARRKNES